MQQQQKQQQEIIEALNRMSPEQFFVAYHWILRFAPKQSSKVIPFARRVGQQ